MRRNNYKDRPNPHIPYDKAASPHDELIAELVCKYTIAGGDVLDIGCGVGHMLSRLQKFDKTLNLQAADIDSQCLDITKTNVSLKACHLISNIEDLCDRDVKVNTVIMSHVLEHTYRPLDAIRAVLDLLKPNGVIILAVPNPVRPVVIIGNLFRRHYVNQGHVYAWDRSHWINFLEKIANVDVIEYPVDYLQIPKVGRNRFLLPVLRFAAKVFPWFSYSNMAVIRKSASD